MKCGNFVRSLNTTRSSGFLIVVAVFVVEAMLFSYGRSETSAVLFGADAVWMTQAQGDAFGVTAKNIPDLKAFASRLTNADAARDAPAAVVLGPCRVMAGTPRAAWPLVSVITGRKQNSFFHSTATSSMSQFLGKSL